MTSKIKLSIEGKKAKYFIKRLADKKIDILFIKYISDTNIEILIYYKDYEKVKKIKTIYDVLEKDFYGPIKIKKLLKINKYLIISFIICFTVFIFLTNIIFDIEVIHSNIQIRTLIEEELNKNGIKVHALKKTNKQLKKIKENILNNNKDKIEWLEIEEVGTKYTVRVEERKITNNNTDNSPRNVIAKKTAIIKKITARSGNIEKEVDSYVSKGDIIINGDIMLYDNSMGKVKADGQVYGEVWYVVKTTYPFVYSEKKLTGNIKSNYSIKFLNKNFELSMHKYKNKQVEEQTVLKHNLLPISLVYQKQREVKVTNDILTFDQALDKAKIKIENKVKSKLKENEYIIRSKYLKSSVNENSVDVEMFFAVYEDITDYQKIIS